MIAPSCNCGCEVNRRAVAKGLVLSGLAAFAAPASRAFARASSAPPRPEDERFMHLALAEAKRGDFPFGAVIEKSGHVLARGRNSGKRANDPTAHGEITAIRHFLARRPASGLKGATIYTTGEPCPMCMAAIIWCGFGRVVYAASIDELSARIGQIMVKSDALANAASFADIEITGGVCAKEALALFSR